MERWPQLVLPKKETRKLLMTLSTEESEEQDLDKE